MSSDYKQSVEFIDTSERSFPKQKKIKSQYFGQYSHFFESVECCKLEQKLEKLKSVNIYYDITIFQQNLNITILDRTQCNQIIKMSVCFAFFMFEIKLLNIFQKSQSKHHLKLLSQGSHGKVFQMHNRFNQKVAIKSIPYSSKIYDSEASQLTKSIRNSIFEYCLCKLFFILEIGPSIKSSSGFDLIVFQDTIQFCMEVCQKQRFDSRNNLKESLKTMHSFNIIHGDIKPDNIMWSPSFQKNVFIDFGLSLLVRETRGQNTFTNFFGTYHYCCDSMKQLMNNGQFGYIDLYYNDTYSLNKIFQCKMDNVCNFKTTQNRQANSNEFINLHSNFELMYLIYLRNLLGVKKFLQHNTKFSLKQNTINLLKYVEYQKEISEIFSILKASNLFTAEDEKTIIKFYHFKSFKFEKSYQQKYLTLENRIGQTFSEFTGVVNDVMLFFFIFYNQDITPISLNRSIFLKNKIQNGNMQEISYWSAFVQYTKNPYVNEKLIFEVFQKVKLRLEIESWEDCSIKQLSLYTKAYQISSAVKQNLGIDLYNIQKDFEEEINGPQKFEETQSLLKNSYSFIPSLIMKIQQFKKNAKQKYQQSMKTLLFSELQAIFSGKQPFFLQLIIQAIDLQFNTPGPIEFSKVERFLNNFTNFKIAKKTKIMTQYQYYLLQRYRNNYKAQVFEETSIFFYRKTANLLFNFYHQIKVFFLPMYKIFTQHSFAVYTQQLDIIKKIVHLGKKIDQNFVIQGIALVFSAVLHQIKSMNVGNIFQDILSCFEQNIIQLIEFYNFDIPQFANYSLCQIFCFTFKKSHKNRQFLIKVFLKMDLAQIQSVAKFSQYSLMKATISLIHQLSTKEDICKLFQTAYSFIQRFLAQYGNCKFILKFYFSYIFFVNGFNVDLCKQVQQLSSLVLRHESNENTLTGCFCLSSFYCWKKGSFETYILFLERFLQKTRCQTDQNNFFAFYSCYIIIEAYVTKKRHKAIAITQIFQHINKSFNLDIQLFCKTNPNFIIAIQLVLKRSATTYDQKLIFRCIYLASFLINKCSPYFSLFFRREMAYLSYVFVKQGLFNCSKRKKSLTYLRLIRNSYYSFTPLEFIKEVIQGHKKGARIRDKMLLMIANRKQNIDIKTINLHYSSAKIYGNFCNMEHSFSQSFSEQEKLFTNSLWNG